MPKVEAVRWDATVPALILIDQTKLPVDFEELVLTKTQDVFDAIVRLSVRGAPAIGCAAAYGVVVAYDEAAGNTETDLASACLKACDYLATSRPTAVNLFWALDRQRAVIQSKPADLRSALLAEADAILNDDREMCAAMGRHGADLMPSEGGILTHCNTGALATGGDGTALSVCFEAYRRHPNVRVYADETRPLMQGSRLTTWECLQRDVPVTLLCDSMAGWAMKKGLIQAVITGSDRITARGDAANKIGTYSVAVLAKHHGIPFYVAAPSSTFDLEIDSGDDIPIEQRNPKEVTHGYGRQTAPDGIDVWNPAFDVTPAELITALITEHGVINPITKDNVIANVRTGSV